MTKFWEWNKCLACVSSENFEVITSTNGLTSLNWSISNQYVIWAVFSSKLKTDKPYDLHCFLRHHFIGKLMVVCQNVGCFLHFVVCFILQEWHCWFRRGKKAVRRSSGVTPSYARLLHGYPPAMEGTFCSRFFLSPKEI